jgi:hypothetical protein
VPALWLATRSPCPCAHRTFMSVRRERGQLSQRPQRRRFHTTYHLLLALFVYAAPRRILVDKERGRYISSRKEQRCSSPVGQWPSVDPPKTFDTWRDQLRDLWGMNIAAARAKSPTRESSPCQHIALRRPDQLPGHSPSGLRCHSVRLSASSTPLHTPFDHSLKHKKNSGRDPKEKSLEPGLNR